jgi:hypothetical protein
MAPWRIAWRSKRAALRAVLAPFCLIFVLHFLGEGLIEEIVGRIVGAGNPLLAAQASLALTLTLYMAIDGLLIAALLEMLLSGRKLADSMPPLVPANRAVRFALAFIPIGLVTSLLHVALRHGVAALLAWRLEDPQEDLAPSPLVSLLMLLLDTSAIQWLVAGLAVAPLALRVLSLPALTAQGRAPPSARPTLGLIWLLLIAVALGTLLQVVLENAVLRGLEAALGAIPGVNTTAAPIIVSEKVGGLAGSYILTFVTTLLIASGVAALLWRRHRSSGSADPGFAMPKEGP